MVKFEQFEKAYAGEFCLCRTKVDGKWNYWFEIAETEKTWDTIDKNASLLAAGLQEWCEEANKGNENWSQFEALIDDYEVKAGIEVVTLRHYGESVAQRKRLLNYVDELVKGVSKMKWLEHLDDLEELEVAGLLDENEKGILQELRRRLL